jgi:hypothetical protein
MSELRGHRVMAVSQMNPHVHIIVSHSYQRYDVEFFVSNQTKSFCIGLCRTWQYLVYKILSSL